jgi:hypothetical protein
MDAPAAGRNEADRLYEGIERFIRDWTEANDKLLRLLTKITAK